MVSCVSAASAAAASSSAPSGVSTPGVRASSSSIGVCSAAVSAGASAFLSAYFLPVTAAPLGSLAASLRASLKISSLSRLGSLTCRVPSAPSMPLNFW